VTTEPVANFIRTLIADDLSAKRYTRIITRFPPEPNGYPHIGHAKSICLNFGLALEFGGTCHLRMDDTNPLKEDQEYVDAIARDIQWLGFDWGEHFYHASDYFQECYDQAISLIERKLAYVDSLSEEEIREYRGTVSEPGKPSPYRDRSIEENLKLFKQMKAGDFPDGAHILRAKGDLSAANMKMRDPLLFRIRHATHHRTGDTWCIYPMYDYAHPISDAVEGVTHSICTLEFENNREIYDWVIANCPVLDRSGKRAWPKQLEFARLNLTATVVSKRKLLKLVQENHVRGWDDPRMPTLSGLRRKGVRPEALRVFCEKIGVARANSVVELELLEGTIREDLSAVSPRVLGVIRPLKVSLIDWQEGVVWKDAPLWPADTGKTDTRKLPITSELFIEQDDFMEEPPKGYHRLSPGREVRLRHGPVIRCEEVTKDAAGKVVELRCTHSWDTAGRKIPGTIHWVSASEGKPAEIRLYDRLFCHERPDSDDEFMQHINPHSLEVVHVLVEPFAAEAAPGSRFQLERVGYFYLEPEDSKPGSPVFNRIVGLKDSWAKEQVKAATGTASTGTAEARTEPKADTNKAASSVVEKIREPATQARFEQLLAADASSQDADTISGNPVLFELYQGVAEIKGAAAWVANEVGRLKEPESLSPDRLGALIRLVEAGTITSRVGRDLLPEVAAGADAATLVAERGLSRISDRGAVEQVVLQLMENNADKVAAYRAGRVGLAGFFVGAAMKALAGKGDPAVVQAVVGEKLAAER
jgi:glutaminyl-tRNA synthetase